MTDDADNALVEPTQRRRRLGDSLRQLRERTGLDQTAFGARAGGLSQPKVSRLETARQVPSLAEAGAWADAAAVDADDREQLLERVDAALTEATSPAEHLRKGAEHRQREIAHLERTASIKRSHVVIVPGLLQTAEYTRRLVHMQAELKPDLYSDIAAGQAAWAARQQVLYQPGKRFEFVLPESALRFRPGPDDDPRMLLAQMHHLSSLTTLDSVRFGVIPWRTAVRVCPMHGFSLFGEPGVDEDVEVEIYTTTRELHIRDEAQIAVYRELWDRLCADAIFGEDARRLIAEIAGEIAEELPK